MDPPSLRRWHPGHLRRATRRRRAAGGEEDLPDRFPLDLGHRGSGAAEDLDRWLGRRGYAEGRNLEVLLRHGDGQLDRRPEAAAELARARPDVIITSINATTQAARKATQTVPIVITGVSRIAAPWDPGQDAAAGRSRLEEAAAAVGAPRITHVDLREDRTLERWLLIPAGMMYHHTGGCLGCQRRRSPSRLTRNSCRT